MYSECLKLLVPWLSETSTLWLWSHRVVSECVLVLWPFLIQKDWSLDFVFTVEVLIAEWACVSVGEVCHFLISEGGAYFLSKVSYNLLVYIVTCRLLIFHYLLFKFAELLLASPCWEKGFFCRTYSLDYDALTLVDFDVSLVIHTCSNQTLSEHVQSCYFSPFPLKL